MPVFEKYFYICFLFRNELYFCDPSYKIFEAFALNLDLKTGVFVLPRDDKYDAHVPWRGLTYSW
jgi:hypothetical protein